MGQGGCDNSLGVIVDQIAEDSVEQTATTAAPIPELNVSGFVGRQITKLSDNSDPVRIFILAGYQAVLSVAQTHYACNGAGCLVAPNITITTPTACQRCGGSLGFLGGNAGMSDRCDVSQYCGEAIALHGHGCGISSPVSPTTSYTGWLGVSATLPQLSGYEDDCSGFQGELLLSITNQSAGLPPVYPLLSPDGGISTLFARRPPFSAGSAPAGAAPLLTLLPLSEQIEVSYVPSWQTDTSESIQATLSPNSSQSCIVDHSRELEAQCTFYIPTGATYANVRVAQTDFATKAVSVSVLLDGKSRDSTTECGGGSSRLFGRSVGQQERCDTYTSCVSQFLYTDDTLAYSNTIGKVVVTLPRGLRSYSCDYLASIIVDFSAPLSEPANCLPSEFECEGERRCISSGYVCDGIQDCLSGLDEKCVQQSLLEGETFCTEQMTEVPTDSLAECTRLAVNMGTLIHSFNGSHCRLIQPATANVILADPQPYLCPPSDNVTASATLTLVSLADTTNFGLCRSSIQCNGNGLATLQGSLCECECNERFSGTYCDVPMKLDHITEIACVLSDVEDTLTVPLTAVAKALRQGNTAVTLACFSLVRDTSNDGETTTIRVTCAATTTRDRPSDETLFYRRLLEQSTWPAINQSLADLSLPSLIYISGRTALTPNVFSSECDGQALCHLNQSDHITVTIARNVTVSSISLDMLTGEEEGTENRRSTTFTCDLAAVSATSGCLRSTCDIPLQVPQNSTFKVSTLTLDAESLLTAPCLAESITVQGRQAVSNIDTFTNDTSVQSSDNFSLFLGFGAALAICAGIAWVLGIVSYLLYLKKIAALDRWIAEVMSTRGISTQSSRMGTLLKPLRFRYECVETSSPRWDRLTTGFLISGTLLVVVAAFLLTYRGTGSEKDSNFSVMYEEYSDSQCQESITSYMPRRIFVAAVGSDCDRMQTSGESVGATYATGYCTGSFGSYEANFKMGASSSGCKSQKTSAIPSGQCVPIQLLDPFSGRSVYIRLICSDSSRILERMTALKVYDGNNDVFVNGDLANPSPRLLADPPSPIYRFPYLVGRELAYSSAFSSNVLATMATTQDFDGNRDSRRVVYQSLTITDDRVWANQITTLVPQSLPQLPFVPELPIGHIFSGFGTSDPVSWIGAGPTAHRYYGIAGGQFDMGAHFPSDRSNPVDDEGYAISLWMRADSSTLGFAYAVADAFEDAETLTVLPLERLASIIDSGNGGGSWLAHYRVYHSLYVDGAARTMTVAYASPDIADKIALISFDLSEIGEAKTMDGRWHHIAVSFAAESKKVRVQLVIDGRSSYSKEGWSDCVDDLPEQVLSAPSQSNTANSSSGIPVFDRVTNVVTTGGVLVVGYFNGAIFGLKAHTKKMLNTDFLPTGTQLMRDTNTFARTGTLSLGVVLLLLSGGLFILFVGTSVSMFRSANSSGDQNLDCHPGSHLLQATWKTLPTEYRRISFATAVSWMGVPASDVMDVITEVNRQCQQPAEFLALIVLRAKSDDYSLQTLTCTEWNLIADTEQNKYSIGAFGSDQKGEEAEQTDEKFTQVEVSVEKPVGQDGVTFGSSSASSSTSPEFLTKIITPIIGVFQGMYVWSSSLSLPSLYDEYFSNLFAFTSLDISGTFPTVSPLLTSVIQVVIGMALLAAVAYLLLEDDRAFAEQLGRYVWRRDTLASNEDVPSDIQITLLGHPDVPFGVEELAILPVASAHQLDLFNGEAAQQNEDTSASKAPELNELTVVSGMGQELTVRKEYPGTSKGPLLVGSDPMPVVGVHCIHHGTILTPLHQTEVWPFANRPRCCIKNCSCDTGTVFSCGTEFTNEEGQPSVCLFALCEEHHRLNHLRDNVPLIVSSFFRSVKMKGPAWLMCAVAITLANAAYTPVMNTALMIVVCHPYYQCEFKCWDNMNQKFALAAFLSFVAIALLGIGLPLSLFTILYRRKNLVSQNSVGPEYKGMYTAPSTNELSKMEWQRFVASDHSALSALYDQLQPKWLFFPPLLVLCKVALLIPAIALEPRSLDQRIGCAVVQIVIALLLFSTNPFTSSLQLQSMRAAELHQLIQLGLQNIDLVIRNDDNNSLAVVMIVITIVYVAATLMTAATALVWPIVQKRSRKTRLTALLGKHKLIFSENVMLYLDGLSQPVEEKYDCCEVIAVTFGKDEGNDCLLYSPQEMVHGVPENEFNRSCDSAREIESESSRVSIGLERMPPPHAAEDSH